MAAERAMSKTQERVIKLITQPSSKRSPVELNFVLPWLKNKSDILFALPDSVLKDIVLNCEYLKTTKDELIIRQGDPGDCLYLLLKGVVSVYINEKKPGSEQSDPLPTQAQEQEVKEPTPVKNWLEVANEIVGEVNGVKPAEKKVDRKTLGRKIVTFASGKAFGEVALLSEENVRTASVISDDDCDLLIIRRKLYNNTVKTYHEEDFKQRREFINNSPLFRTWSDKHKKQLERALIKESYSPDMPIIKQGEELKGLIFIRGGFAKVMVEPDKHVSQYPHMVPFPTENDIFELEHIKPHKPTTKNNKYSQGNKFNKSQYKSTNSNHKAESEDKSQTASLQKSKSQQVTFENVFIKRKQGYAAAEKRMLNRSVILCTVKDGAMFGDVEMMHNLKTFSQAVIALTYTEIYYITAKNVERLIQKRHPNTIKLLTDIVVWKMCNRATSVQGSIVPFVKHLVFKMTEEIKPVPRTMHSLPYKSKYLPEREIIFQNILQEYLKDKAPLIEPLVAGGVYYKTVMRKKAKQREVVRRKKEEIRREMLENEMRAKMSNYSNELQKSITHAWLASDDEEEEKLEASEETKTSPQQKESNEFENNVSNHLAADLKQTATVTDTKAFLTEVDTLSSASKTTLNSKQPVNIKKPKLKKFVPHPPPQPQVPAKNNLTLCFVYDEISGESVMKQVGAIQQQVKTDTPTNRDTLATSTENVTEVKQSLSSSDEGVNLSGISDNTCSSENKLWVSRAPSDGRMVGAPAHMITSRTVGEKNYCVEKESIIDLCDESIVDSKNTSSGAQKTTDKDRPILPAINNNNGKVIVSGERSIPPPLVKRLSRDSGCFDDELPYGEITLRARTAALIRNEDRQEVLTLPKMLSAGNKRQSLTAVAVKI